MRDYLFFFLLILAVTAAVLRADFVLTIIYLLLGVFVAGQWWSRKALASVRVRRLFSSRAFYGEQIPVTLQMENSSWLPVVWLQVRESLPVFLGRSGRIHQVISLGGKDRAQLVYTLEGRRRGYYPIGPLNLFSGDIFGLSGDQQRQLEPDYLTVYPRIIPLSRVDLPSHSPLGTMRHKQPVFEDPSRVLGKRDYIAGDSLRRVDWKASANAGRLQVKLFEPSIALETMIFLNLNSSEYDFRTHFDSGELGIVAAASLAAWVIGKRQSTGLVTNGIDPLAENGVPPRTPSRRGRGHLMRILDVLARVQMGDTYPLVELLQRELVHLGWGTTLILITSNVDDALFDVLFQARRKGLGAVLVSCGPLPYVEEKRRRAENFGFPFHHLLNEQDLDRWRR